MTNHSILTIEDDAAIRRGIVDSLCHAGYRVLSSEDGEQGLEMAIHREIDLLLLDLALPKLSGLEVLRAVREIKPTIAIIILTAKGNEEDRVAGLKMGADDYVVKPFSMKELFARVEAVLRRSTNRPFAVQTITWLRGRAVLDRRELQFVDGTTIELTEMDCHLLHYLASHLGRAISRDELLTNVWHLKPQGLNTRTVDMQIARLREKFRDNGESLTILKTVRGKGYMLCIESVTVHPQQSH